VVIGGTNDAPSGGHASGGGTPTLQPGTTVGPGARPSGSGGSTGPQLQVSPNSLVWNPNPVAGGSGGRSTIDPYGGRR
jgi:hypothetical protein